MDRPSDILVGEHQLLERFARDLRDQSARQHLHIVVGFREEHVLEVERLPRDMD